MSQKKMNPAIAGFFLTPEVVATREGLAGVSSFRPIESDCGLDRGCRPQSTKTGALVKLCKT